MPETIVRHAEVHPDGSVTLTVDYYADPPYPGFDPNVERSTTLDLSVEDLSVIRAALQAQRAASPQG